MGETDALSVIPTHPHCLWQPSQETCLISFCGTWRHLAHSGARGLKWMQLFDCNVDRGSNYFILGLFSYAEIYLNDLCNLSIRVNPKNLKTSLDKSILNEPIMIEWITLVRCISLSFTVSCTALTPLFIISEPAEEK